MGPPQKWTRKWTPQKWTWKWTLPESEHGSGPPQKWTWKWTPLEVNTEVDPPEVNMEVDPPEVNMEVDPPIEVDAEEVVEEDQLRSIAGQEAGMP